MPRNEPRQVVLMFHSRYRIAGGEEGSFEQEAALLESMGYETVRMETTNDLAGSGVRAAAKAIFNPGAFRDACAAIKRHRPAFIYVNNLWPGFSPAVLWAARLNRVPSLQALRNYRLICPSAKLANDGSCLNCGSQNYPLSCVISGCYNASRLQSLVVAVFSLSMRLANRGRANHKYLATSQVTSDLLVAGGIPKDQIRVRPNFLTSSLPPSNGAGQGVVFVGRLSHEKGIFELVSEWSKLEEPPVLTLIGQGPLADFVARAATQDKSSIRWLGSCQSHEVLQIVKDSALAIVPSQWAEPFGRVAIEAMSVGTPVMFTEGGALKEVVGDTGIFLPQISSAALQTALKAVDDPVLLKRLSRKSFARYTKLFSAEAAVDDMRGHIGSVVS